MAPSALKEAQRAVVAVRNAIANAVAVRTSRAYARGMDGEGIRRFDLTDASARGYPNGVKAGAR